MAWNINFSKRFLLQKITPNRFAETLSTKFRRKFFYRDKFFAVIFDKVLADKYNSKYMLSMMGGALGILANITFSLPLTISIISGTLLGTYISNKL